MTACAVHIPDPDTAAPVDDGLRAALDLHALAEVGLPAGPEARRAALGVLRWLDGGEGAEGTLDATLGLAAPGRTHARQRLRMKRRDTDLRVLWRAHWPELSSYAAGEAIALRWRRYMASGWPRHRKAGTVPPTDPDASLHRLLDRGHEPLAAETIRKVLSGAIGQFAPVELTGPTDDIRD